MPVMDGIEALTRLREWYDGPIVIFSTNDEEKQKVRALDLGADDYLTKPFGLDELAARVRSAIRRTQRLSAPERAQTLWRWEAFGSTLQSAPWSAQARRCL
jgi:two-component system KDP operon response regulator KdpE